MGRITRSELLYEGCYAHVISRSIRKLKLFKEAEDFKFFESLLLQAKRKAKFKIYHYCFMQTHFHLAVKIGDLKSFSSAMRDIKRDYAYKFHSKYKLSGPVWRERFKSLLIENEDYLYTCGKYIHENPVKAGLVREGCDWMYSSARYYELSETNRLVDGYDGDYKEVNGVELDEENFEGTSVIGSSFFRFQFMDSRRRARRVP